MTLNKQIIENQRLQTESDIKLEGADFWSLERVIKDGKEHAETIRRLRKDAVKNGIDRGAIWSNMQGLADRAYEYGVYRRITEDDPKYFLDGIFTYGRLQYIADCLNVDLKMCFVWDSPLAILAGKDEGVIEAYLKNYSPPSNIISKVLYFTLKDDPADSNALHHFGSEAQSRKTLPRYFKSMIQCFVGIYDKNSSVVAEGLDYVTARSWQMRNNLPYLSIKAEGIPLYAHAIYNLARSVFKKHNIPMPSASKHPLWDADYDAYVADENNLPALLFDYSEISPYLAQIMAEPPKEVDVFSL